MHCLAGGVRAKTSRRGLNQEQASNWPISLSAAGLYLWTLESQALHSAPCRLQATSLDVTKCPGSARSKCDGTDILLNGQAGISAWHLDPRRGSHRDGRANGDEDAATLQMGWAKELGCNYVRLAHYPHDQRMTRAADRLRG